MTNNNKNNIITENNKEIITEMCDICGKNYPAPIPRFKYISKSSRQYIIRYCPNCNPILFGQSYLP